MASARGNHGSIDKIPAGQLSPGFSAGAFLCSTGVIRAFSAIGYYETNPTKWRYGKLRER
jgi:hypothetical protein